MKIAKNRYKINNKNSVDQIFNNIMKKLNRSSYIYLIKKYVIASLTGNKKILKFVYDFDNNDKLFKEEKEKIFDKIINNYYQSLRGVKPNMSEIYNGIELQNYAEHFQMTKYHSLQKSISLFIKDKETDLENILRSFMDINYENNSSNKNHFNGFINSYKIEPFRTLANKKAIYLLHQIYNRKENRKTIDINELISDKHLSWDDTGLNTLLINWHSELRNGDKIDGVKKRNSSLDSSSSSKISTIQPTRMYYYGALLGVFALAGVSGFIFLRNRQRSDKSKSD